MVGISALESLFTPNPATAPQAIAAEAPPLPDAPLSAPIGELAESDHGLIMCMGKGGVGKTTIAAALAEGVGACIRTSDAVARCGSVGLDRRVGSTGW
ncbi:MULTISPECIES: hypothetical protein [Rhodococcus]|uniref:hypothetical protein n=1 Tax=Rhodococcus TaxID=1827 RepID=UPI0006BB44E4|nr:MULTISPECIES: hypothetical protein [Rhodococcus]